MLATAAQTSSSVGGAPNTTPVASPLEPGMSGLVPAATTSSQSSSPSRRSERDSQDAVEPRMEDGGGGDVAHSGLPAERDRQRPRLTSRTRLPALLTRRSVTTHTTIENALPASPLPRWVSTMVCST